MKLVNSVTCLCLGAAGVLGLATMAQADIIADWTFETSLPTTAGPVAPEVGSGAASVSVANSPAYSSPAGNGSLHSYMATKWADNDYWQFMVSTTGYQDITLHLEQASTSTTANAGPGTFQLFYSTDNVTYTSFGDPYIVHANNVTGWTSASVSSDPNSAYTFDLSSITAINNKTAVYIRAVATAPFNGAYGVNPNNSRVDNVVISGTALPVPEPASLGLLALGGGMILVRRRRQA